MESETKTSRVMRGFFSGLKTGLLVMSIFALVSASAAVLFGTTSIGFGTALVKAIEPAVIGTVVSSLFGAANQLFSSEPTSANHAPSMRMRDARIQQASQTVVPLLVPGHSVAQSAERSQEAAQSQQQSSWREKVRTSDSRMQAILNNGELSGSSRAAAILAERERAANAQHSV